VLIPRPDTETLVEAALARAPRREAPLAVLDVGTGSGAIALALAREWPEARVTATDASDAALAVARSNAEALGLEGRVRFASGDLFAPVAGERFDVIVSNPPYVPEADAAGLAPELRHEPRLALFVPGDGAALLRRIAREAPARLAPGGLLALELAPAQAADVTQCLRESGFDGLAEHRDLAGRVRAVSALWPGRE
jgi:release factor glutamine methyltransferase